MDDQVRLRFTQPHRIETVAAAKAERARVACRFHVHVRVANEDRASRRNLPAEHGGCFLDESGHGELNAQSACEVKKPCRDARMRRCRQHGRRQTSQCPGWARLD